MAIPSKILKVIRYCCFKLLGILNRHVLLSLEFLLSPKEKSPIIHPPIFIVGAPRSGSTLLFQVLAQSYNFGYLTNLHNYFSGSPAIIQIIFGKFLKKKVSTYSSAFGRVKGLASPSEAGEYWYNFFAKKPVDTSFNDIDNQMLIKFRRSIIWLSRVFGKPVLFKNLNTSLRLSVTANAIPEALYIHVVRKTLDNSHSLLEARYKINGNYNDWWSVEPPAISELKYLPPEQQVVEQITQLNSLIDNDLIQNGVNPKKIFHVNYESFCEDVYGTLDLFETFLENNAICCKRNNEVPDKFNRREEVRIDEKIYVLLKKYINKAKPNAIK